MPGVVPPRPIRRATPTQPRHPAVVRRSLMTPAPGLDLRTRRTRPATSVSSPRRPWSMLVRSSRPMRLPTLLEQRGRAVRHTTWARGSMSRLVVVRPYRLRCFQTATRSMHRRSRPARSLCPQACSPTATRSTHRRSRPARSRCLQACSPTATRSLRQRLRRVALRSRRACSPTATRSTHRRSQPVT